MPPGTALAIRPRRAICLDCRTRLVEGEPCDGGPQHRVVSLDTGGGRRMLLREIWGPPSARRQARAAARAAGTGAGFSLFDGCSGCSDLGYFEGLGTIIAIVGVALLAVGLVLVAWRAIEAWRRYRALPRPKSALLLPPSLGDRSPREGVVEGNPSLRAPASGRPCLAWSIDVGIGSVLLGLRRTFRDAAAGRFTILLDDGSRVRVPAGRIRLEGPPRSRPRELTASVDAEVESLLPAGSPDAGYANLPLGYEPIPWDAADEIMLAPGDRVALFNPLDTAPDPDAAVGYRDPAMTLVPAGVPAIRIIAARRTE